jgi:hypothetical protein
VCEQGELASSRGLRSRRGSRQRHHFRGGGGLFIFSYRRPPEANAFSARTGFGLRPAASSAQAAKGIGFKSGMHVGYFYLMIAALVLMGLEVLYALYQLATFL